MVIEKIITMQNISILKLEPGKNMQKDYRIYHILYVDNRRFIPLEIYNSLKSSRR
jgi:hypothetical protein